MRGRIIEQMRHVPTPNDDLKLSEQVYWGFGGDPVKMLRVFLDVSQHPRRSELMLDVEMLGWLQRMWEAAALACPHADDVRREAERYKHLRKRLADTLFETRGDAHIWLNEASDWPHPKTILRAMFGLLQAEQRTIQ